jgi:hypothetical protein
MDKIAQTHLIPTCKGVWLVTSLPDYQPDPFHDLPSHLINRHNLLIRLYWCSVVASFASLSKLLHLVNEKLFIKVKISVLWFQVLNFFKHKSRPTNKPPLAPPSQAQWKGAGRASTSKSVGLSLNAEPFLRSETDVGLTLSLHLGLIWSFEDLSFGFA